MKLSEYLFSLAKCGKIIKLGKFAEDILSAAREKCCCAGCTNHQPSRLRDSIKSQHVRTVGYIESILTKLPVIHEIIPENRSKSFSPVGFAVENRSKSFSPVGFAVENRSKSFSPVRFAVENRSKSFSPMGFAVENRSK